MKAGIACRDVLYLDLALETAVRSSIESALSLFGKPTSAQQLATQGSLVINMVATCAESACLSMGSNIELLMACKEFKVEMHWLQQQGLHCCVLSY